MRTADIPPRFPACSVNSNHIVVIYYLVYILVYTGIYYIHTLYIYCTEYRMRDSLLREFHFRS